MHFLQAINSDISVLIVCNKTGGTIEGDIKKILGYHGVGSGGYEMKYKINGSKLIPCVKDRKKEWECVSRTAIRSVTYSFEKACCFNMYTPLLLRFN